MKRPAFLDAIMGAILMVSVGTIGVLAQPAGTPINPVASVVAGQRAEIHAEIAAVRAQAKAAGATREQIRALRAALRAKLAAMRH